MSERLKPPDSGPASLAVALAPDALEGVAGEDRYPPPFDRL